MVQLKSKFDIFAWYDEVKASGKLVAWCSAFAPAEILVALGIIPVYPENHAAILGALLPDRNPDHHYSYDANDQSEKIGVRTPGFCKYALSDISILLGNVVSPINGLPKPDLFYSCNSQCSIVERWGRHRHLTLMEAPQG